MKITYDKNAGAVYLHIKNTFIVSTREYNGKVVFDLDRDGEICGLELIGGEIKEILCPENTISNQ